MSGLKKDRNKILARAAVIAAAVLSAAFLAHGISRGEAQVVLKRAVMICMECIGLG